MPDLAVIMSVYINDRLEFVKESVESIISQSYTNFDYFISFDGPVSVDIDNYITSLTDGRIKLLRIGKNGGLARALNMMLEDIMVTPQYKFIARMDADDISMPERFRKQRDFLVANQAITVVGSGYEEIDEDGKHISYRKLPTDHEALRKRYYTRTPFAHSSVMFHRRLIEIAGNYPTDTMLMEDNVLWGRALKEGLRFGNIPEVLLKFRIDRNFHKRRSGFKYGMQYLKTRLAVTGRINSLHYINPLILLIGLVKALPACISKYIFMAMRKWRVLRSRETK